MEPLNSLSRRQLLQLGAVSASWLTPAATMLARAAERDKKAPAQSIIILWMQGAPSQLETFDPHPGAYISGGTKAIPTAAKGVQLAEGLERTAEQMADVTLIRSMTSKEGDHDRGTYTMKTGYRPDPTILHPSLGAICCHELPKGGTDIPRHISILPGEWPARGGFLGDRLDAFRMDDPAGPVPDTQSFLPADRDNARKSHLSVIEGAFLQGRQRQVDATNHTHTMAEARKMMSSEQLRAFDVSKEPAEVRKKYGETAFGRGCLAARRLIEVGVRCVEVTLSGWDTHANNHGFHRSQLQILDPAFAALLADLRERKLLDRTLVFCGGEFGRTPTINPLGGRDHWPVGFSIALAGGGVRGGQVLGATDPEGKKPPTQPVPVADLTATMLTAVGLDPTKLSQTPIGRTVKYSEGTPLPGLLRG
ncbi:MAG: DUF1501 domain-containing protein [Gemmataceae bacterium]